ncbi:UDP-N-acetylmuramoyl-L-alanine--D-glutamate ligase [Paracoccaceae bacterium GXU_MW_L88]
MIPIPSIESQTIGILGLGRSGLAAARAVAASGGTPICWDDNEAGREKAAEEGFETRDLTRDASWEGIDLLVTSPGIPHLYPAPHPVIAAALDRGVPVDNDIGLFFRALEDIAGEYDPEPKVICITGSNGKSTTTALTAHLLETAGRKVQMGGNIGRGVFDLDPPEDGMVYVLELSSYQTDLARMLAPDVAVFMNLSLDHLDRHGGMGGYFAAKARLFTLGQPNRAVIGVDQMEGRYLAGQMETTGSEVIRISSARKVAGPGWRVFARKGFLTEWRGEKQMASVDLRSLRGLPGTHNHQNACAAWAACRSLGIGPKDLAKGLESFGGLPHRCQILGTAKGVTWVNDSKATNADAAEQALKAFERIRWIAGGVAKEGGITPLLPLMDRVEKTYLIGEAAPDFAQTLRNEPHEVCETLERAVARAAEEAREGDVILLAPACASFDQYPSFEHRGRDFEDLVKPLLKD